MTESRKFKRFALEVLARPFPSASAKTLPSGVADAFVHDWASGVTMETTYRTSIVASSDNDVEERRGLLSRPHRSISATWAGLDKEVLDRLLVVCRKMPSSQWVMPLYQDQINLDADYTSMEGGSANLTIYCTPANRRFFSGARIVILVFSDGGYHPTSVIYRTITERRADRLILDSDLGENLDMKTVLILPCIDIEYILEPALSYTTDQKAILTLDGDEIIGPSSLPPTWQGLVPGFSHYAGIPIFDPDHDWSVTREISYARTGSLAAQGRGVVANLRGDHARLVTRFSIGAERDVIFKIVQFFDSRMGRLLPFWTIDPETLWTVTAVGSTYVDVEPLGDSDDFQLDFDYLGIRLKNGSRIVRPVNTFTIGTDWRVHLSSALPTGVIVSDIDSVARARLSRFNTDVLAETWSTETWGTVGIDTIELLDDREIAL